MTEPHATATPTFEQALDELQEIVRSLEDGSVGLEESMRQFERGMLLLRECHRLLETAEQRIEILTGTDRDGNPLTAPFDATATHEPAQPQAGRRTSKAARKAPPKKPTASESATNAPTAENRDDRDNESGSTLF